MSTSILLSVLSGVSFAGAGLGYKMGERWQCRSSQFILVFATTGAAFAGVKALFEPTTWLDPRLWLLGVAMGLLFDLAIVFLMQANRLGPASASWTVLNLGLLLPILVSPLVFAEAVLWVDPVIVVLFVGMLLMFARGMRRSGEVAAERRWRHVLCLLGVFLTQGLFLLGNKVKHLLFGDANTAGLTFVVFVGGATAVLLALGATGGRLNFTRRELQAGAVTGVCNGLGSMLLLGAMSLPSTMVFPLSASVALLGGVFLTGLVFGERLDRAKTAAVMLGMAALILAVSRESVARLLAGS